MCHILFLSLTMMRLLFVFLLHTVHSFCKVNPILTTDYYLFDYPFHKKCFFLFFFSIFLPGFFSCQAFFFPVQASSGFADDAVYVVLDACALAAF